MPDIETACRFQDAALWEASGNDNYGTVSVKAPVSLKVRWEDRIRESVGSDGKPIRFDAAVVVDRVIPIGSLMRLGPLSDVSGTTTGSAVTGLHQVVDRHEAPDLFGQHVRRELMLRRFTGVLPEVS